MADDTANSLNIPYGYCHCGCGAKTKPSPRTSTHHGYVKGEPRRFIPGHYRSPRKPFSAISSQYQVDPVNGCWNWTGAKNKKGYGAIYRLGRSRQAHRYIYEQIKGPVPAGLDLDHLCKNPSCVNPDHLEPVTRTINNRRSRATKLTPEDVKEIRSRLPYEPDNQIAKSYGVDRQAINRIRRGCSWVDEVAA